MSTERLAHRLLNVSDLVARLEKLSNSESCSLAFDGDGTLWSGDVSDDVFLAACRSNFILDTVRPQLLPILCEHGIATDGTVGELAYRLFEAEKRGQLEERLLFEVMTWCYAGRAVAELSEFANRVLMEAGIESRIRFGYRPLLDWAGASGHSCWLVTASPWPIVRLAATKLGFAGHQIIASRPIESNTGIISASMAAPVPYREQKLLQLNARRNHRSRLLAAFGDSAFDLDLLRAAEIAVAVRPKPSLEDQLESLDHAVVLDL
jgi:phosphatidylglycerophosphatase C